MQKHILDESTHSFQLMLVVVIDSSSYYWLVTYTYMYKIDNDYYGI